jgi:hypothetical protein
MSSTGFGGFCLSSLAISCFYLVERIVDAHSGPFEKTEKIAHRTTQTCLSWPPKLELAQKWHSRRTAQFSSGSKFMISLVAVDLNHRPLGYEGNSALHAKQQEPTTKRKH